jgi:hypothetical protein
MAGKIFINYRRGDDPGYTGRLFDRLQDAFAPEQLFLDVDNIAPGLDFARVIEERVADCDVMLAIIGKSWIDARDAAGNRRLDLPDDFVRLEIASALTQEKRVIPILVADAQMPRADELPEDLRPLARRNAVRLTHERFRSDVQGLVAALESALSDFDLMRAGREKAGQGGPVAQIPPQPVTARSDRREAARPRRPLAWALGGAGAVAAVCIGAAVFWTRTAPISLPTTIAARDASGPAGVPSPPSAVPTDGSAAPQPAASPTPAPASPVVAAGPARTEQPAYSPPANAAGDVYPPVRTRSVKRDVSLGYLNLRSGPGQNEKVLGRIPAGTKGIAMTGSCVAAKDGSTYPFCYVEWGGLRGWVSSNGLE